MLETGESQFITKGRFLPLWLCDPPVLVVVGSCVNVVMAMVVAMIVMTIVVVTMTVVMPKDLLMVVDDGSERWYRCDDSSVMDA